MYDSKSGVIESHTGLLKRSVKEENSEQEVASLHATKLKVKLRRKEPSTPASFILKAPLEDTSASLRRSSLPPDLQSQRRRSVLLNGIRHLEDAPPNIPAE